MVSEFACRREREQAWISLIAAYTGSVLFPSTSFMTGVIYVALLKHFRDDPVKTSLVGSFNSALLCLLGPFVGIVINKYSCRVAVVSGGLIIAMASFVSAFVPSVDWLIFTYGIIGGIGSALTTIPLNVVLGFCFTKHRDILMSLSSVMIGLGMLISTPLALYIIKTYSISGAFIILTGMYLNQCVVGMLMKPSTMEIRIQRQRKLRELDAAKQDSNRGLVERVKGVVRGTAVVYLDLPFVMFLIGTCSWNLMLMVCQMHLPNYMDTKGASSAHISSIMVCFGISNIVGRLVGALSLAKTDSIDPFKLNILALVVSGVCTTVFPLYKHLMNSEYILASCAGSMTGLPNALLSPLAIRFLGVENISLSYGFIFFACGIGFLSGPPIASALYKSTGVYDWSFVFAGLVNLAGALCALMSFIIYRRRYVPPQTEQTMETSIELLNGKQSKHTEET